MAVEVCVDDDKRDNTSSVAVSPEKQHQLQPGRLAWASSSALTDCSVCLEAYRNGDRVCRLPCAHAFHAAVRRPSRESNKYRMIKKSKKETRPREMKSDEAVSHVFK